MSEDTEKWQPTRGRRQNFHRRMRGKESKKINYETAYKIIHNFHVENRGKKSDGFQNLLSYIAMQAATKVDLFAILQSDLLTTIETIDVRYPVLVGFKKVVDLVEKSKAGLDLEGLGFFYPGIDLRSPNEKRLIAAYLSLKGVAASLMQKGMAVNTQYFISVFEGALLPYYVPEEHVQKLLRNANTLRDAVLQKKPLTERPTIDNLLGKV